MWFSLPDVSRETTPSSDRLSALFPARELQIVEYATLLATVGIDHGAVGPGEVGRIWERHILNCRLAAGLFTEGASLIDVGSGAGLPGLVFALARTDLKVTLLEPLQRRVTLLEFFVETLGLGEQVTVVRGRAEEHRHVQQYEYVTARAVAKLHRLLQLCWPLVAPGGSLVALKGAGAADEVREAAPLLARLKAESVEVLEIPGYPEAPEPGRVIRIRR